MRKIDNKSSKNVKKLQQEESEKMNIIRELRLAEQKHPNFPTDIFKQLAIMQEEAGEVTMSVNDFYFSNKSIEDVKTELRQTAAMCIRMLINLNE